MKYIKSNYMVGNSMSVNGVEWVSSYGMGKEVVVWSSESSKLVVYTVPTDVEGEFMVIVANSNQMVIKSNKFSLRGMDVTMEEQLQVYMNKVMSSIQTLKK